MSNASSLKDDPDSYFKHYSRNYSFACAELACGVALFSVSYTIPDEDIQHYLVVASIGMIVDATSRLGQNVVEAYFESMITHQNKALVRKKKLTVGQTRQERFNELQLAHVPTTIDKVRCRIGQAKLVVNLAINLGTIYQLASGNASDSIDFTDAGMIITAGFCGASAVSNANELYYSFKTGQTRPDRPLIQIGSGTCEAVNAAIYRTNNLSLQPISRVGNTIYAWYALTPGQRAIYRALQTHGDYQLFMGLFQGAWNTVNYFRQPLLEEMPKEPAIDRNPPRMRHAQRTPSIEQTQMMPPEPILPHQPAMPTTATPSAVEPRTKFKTRGVANPPSAVAPAAQAVAAREADAERNAIRAAALLRLDVLSLQPTVSVQEMDREINALLRFLPDADRVNAGHNKDAIVLYFENGSRFRTTFETPHHQKAAGSNEYKKARKERALDSLRICYLLGWDEQEIRAYMAQNNRGSFYNLPAFLVHILWSRGRL
jgi:hypothetical protein